VTPILVTTEVFVINLETPIHVHVAETITVKNVTVCTTITASFH
jgi:hypothetical protein